MTFILQMHLHSFCFLLTRLPVYLFSSGLFSKQNTNFRKIIGRGRFSSKVPVAFVEGQFYTNVEDHWPTASHNCSHVTRDAGTSVKQGGQKKS